MSNPSAGSLAAFTPNLSSLVTAILAVGVACVAITLAVRGFLIVQSMVQEFDYNSRHRPERIDEDKEHCHRERDFHRERDSHRDRDGSHDRD